MFCIPDVKYFNDFNMILNDNVIDCFLVENVSIEQDNVEKIRCEPPQQDTYKYKKTAKVRNKKLR
jgi:hypothetical protein